MPLRVTQPVRSYGRNGQAADPGITGNAYKYRPRTGERIRNHHPYRAGSLPKTFDGAIAGLGQWMTTLGGDLIVESAPEASSCLTVDLPLDDPSRAEEEE